MSTEGGRKRAYVPKQMKYAQNKANDAKRRKIDDKSQKKSAKGDDQKRENKPKFAGKGKKQENGDRKFKSKGKSDDGATAKKTKKIKSKKSKGKKKSHRNKNKWTVRARAPMPSCYLRIYIEKNKDFNLLPFIGCGSLFILILYARTSSLDDSINECSIKPKRSEWKTEKNLGRTRLKPSNVLQNTWNVIHTCRKQHVCHVNTSAWCVVYIMQFYPISFSHARALP